MVCVWVRMGIRSAQIMRRDGHAAIHLHVDLTIHLHADGDFAALQQGLHVAREVGDLHRHGPAHGVKPASISRWSPPNTWLAIMKKAMNRVFEVMYVPR